MGQGGCWGWLTPLELIGIVIYIFSEINKKRRVSNLCVSWVEGDGDD